ncbi:hypothetical protein [Methylobacterium sp. J-092]|uniref:hypothetical protein n=1 Tax=Methylobacterium sp. J-092 TaxID=2836667 RepID=UPI001FBBF8F5|nr:hypothetical protein [Methylobacterium sp. J-092]MCJ2008246.1 hypothetical protein [Methylobacterium sp. J-092]
MLPMPGRRPAEAEVHRIARAIGQHDVGEIDVVPIRWRHVDRGTRQSVDDGRQSAGEFVPRGIVCATALMVPDQVLAVVTFVGETDGEAVIREAYLDRQRTADLVDEERQTARLQMGKVEPHAIDHVVEIGHGPFRIGLRA